MTMSHNTSQPQILHVVHSLEPGGTERMLCRLVEALGETDANDPDGAKHTICSLRDPRPFEGTLGDGLSVFSLSARNRDRFLYRRLAAAIRERNINIVHARNWGTWTDAGLACQSVGGVQLVLGFHGLQNGKAFTALQRVRAKLLHLSSLPTTAVSNAARDVLVNSLGFDASNIKVIPNGVDGVRFSQRTDESRHIARDKLSLPNGTFVIGSVANFFERVKGLDVLIDAFAKVATQHANTHLVLVGYGPLEKELRSQVGRLKLDERITFAGRVECVEEVLPAFDIFACPSRSEGLSNAVLEAMATGLPCVVTDVSDHRSMFGPIDSELIVPPEDAMQLAHAMTRLIDNANLRSAAGTAARKLIEERYSFDACAEAYKKMYARLIRIGFNRRQHWTDDSTSQQRALAH